MVLAVIGAILICLGIAGAFDLGGVLSRRVDAVGMTTRGRGFADHPVVTRMAFACVLIAIGIGWLIAGLQ